MGFGKHWRKLKSYRRWRNADTPILFNEQTGELRSFTAAIEQPAGQWLLRRPLSLPESSKSLFFTIRIKSDK